MLRNCFVDYPPEQRKIYILSFCIEASLLYLLPFELAHVKMVVKTVLIEQLAVSAFFDNFPIIDDQHLVCIADGAEAMGNNKACSPFHKP